MAQIAVEMTGDPNKLNRALGQAEKQVARLEAKLKETAAVSKRVEDAGEKAGRKLDSAGDRAAKAFGTKALASLKSYASGVVGLTAAVAVLKQTWDAVDQARQQAMDTQAAAEMGMTQLAQLSGGDPARYKRLTRKARDLFGAGGAESLDAAARTVFSLESAGALDALPLFQDLYGVVGAPDVFATAAATMRTSMGAAETGGMRAIASKAFAASKFSPASAEALLQAAAKSGALGKSLGMTDEGVLAATALLATASGSAEQGGTMLAGMLRAMLKGGEYDVVTGYDDAGNPITSKKGLPRVQGLGLKGAVDTFAGLNLTDEQMIKAMGRGDAFIAYATLRDNPKAFAEAMSAQQQAETGNLVQKILDVRETDPTYALARQLRIKHAYGVLTMEKAAAERFISEAMIERKLAEHIAAGGSEFVGQFGALSMRWQRRLGSPFESPSSYIVSKYGTAAEQQLLEDTSRAVERAMYPPIEVVKRLDNAAKNLRSGPTLSNPDRDR